MARALGQGALVPDPGLHLPEVEWLLAEVAGSAALGALLLATAGLELQTHLLPDFGLKVDHGSGLNKLQLSTRSTWLLLS